MARTVFFSWQSDSTNNVGRGFLESVLQEICDDLSGDTSLEEADRDDAKVMLDTDTRNVPGQPPIFEVILEKIEKAAVFVADLTFVGDRKNGSGPVPNPNVLIEHGYALHALKYRRVINVMNTAYGIPSAMNLPFDIRHTKKPIEYNLPEAAKEEDARIEHDRLLPILREAIIASMKTVSPSAEKSESKFPEKSPENGPARFRANGNPIGVNYGQFVEESGVKLYLHNGPAIWLRVMPVEKRPANLRQVELNKMVYEGNDKVRTIFNQAGNYGHVRAADGVGLWGPGREDGEDAHRAYVPAVMFILDTGEIWSVDVAVASFMKNTIPFFERQAADALLSYSSLLEKYGMKGPYTWIAGVTGVEGKRLDKGPEPPNRRYLLDYGPTCLVDTIEDRGTYSIGQDPIAALRPFFEKLFDQAAAMERPAHLG